MKLAQYVYDYKILARVDNGPDGTINGVIFSYLVNKNR